MIRLEMKNNHGILIEKQQKYRHYQMEKYLEEILSSNQRRIIEQAKVAYAFLEKAFEKQTEQVLQSRKNLLNHPEDPEKLEEFEVMERVIKIQECYVDLIQTRSRRVKFWTQCHRYVNILKSFIRVEGTGNWSLHLQSMSNTINLFTSTDHINYAKCCSPKQNISGFMKDFQYMVFTRYNGVTVFGQVLR